MNIYPLINATFVNLEFLNLSTNKIDDSNINHLKDFKFKNLKYLNLDANLINDYRIFFAIANNKNFGKLEQLYLNYNILYCLTDENGKTIEKKKLKDYFAEVYLDFNSIQKLGVSNGVFDKQSIEYIFPCLELNNVKEIKLKYNNLVNYNFLFTKNKCQWCRQLEKDIRDNKKPKVEKIFLKEGNYIKIKEHKEEIKFLESFIY